MQGAVMKTPKIRILIIATVLLLASTSVYAEPWIWQYLPHVAAGGGWTSYLTIADPHGVDSKTVWIYFYDDSGQPLYLKVDDGIAQSSFSFTLKAYQERTFVITAGSAPLGGQLQIASQGIERLDASLRFASSDGSGNIIDAVGVLPVIPNFIWSFATDKQKGGDMGVGIANPWAPDPQNPKSLVVSFNLYQNGTRVSGTSTVTKSIAPQGHLAIFVSQLFPNANYSGTATLTVSSAQSSFSAIALRADKSQYSSLSVNSEVQSWSAAITGKSGVETWAWRFIDGYTFTGTGTNPDNTSSGFVIRGVSATDLSPQYFLLEWNYEYLTSDNIKTQGVMLYQGTIGTEGGVGIINGTRQQIRLDGTIINTATFKATRIS
jgi:hypothetical protein